MDGWSVAQYMNVYKGRSLKKSSNWKSKLPCQRWSLHGVQTSHFTVLAINSESHLTLFPSFCAQSSEVAVLFYSNLSRCPFLEQVVDLDLLLCTGFNLEDAVLFQCHILTQRPTADRKIERSDGCCFGWQQLLSNSIEIFISMKKKVISCCPNSQSIKTCPRLTMPVLG